LRELLGVDEMGGTMRLGAWPCKIEKDSTAFRAYGSPKSVSATVTGMNSTANTKRR